MIDKTYILDFRAFPYWDIETRDAASILFAPHNPSDPKSIRHKKLWSPDSYDLCHNFTSSGANWATDSAKITVNLQQHVIKFNEKLLVAFDYCGYCAENILGSGAEGKVIDTVAVVEMNISSAGGITFSMAAISGKSVIKRRECLYDNSAMHNPGEKARKCKHFVNKGKREASIVQRVYPLDLREGGNYVVQHDLNKKRQNRTDATKTYSVNAAATAAITYTLMEKKQGKSFGAFLQNVEKGIIRLTKSSILEIAIQILNEMQRIQKEGIAHRDINPKNIIISYSVDHNNCPINTRVSFVDFGYAKKIDELDKLYDQKIRGTCGFIAPEIFKESHMKPFSFWLRADSFSVGRVLALLFGAINKTDFFHGRKLDNLDEVYKFLSSPTGLDLPPIREKMAKLGFSAYQCERIVTGLVDQLLDQNPDKREGYSMVIEFFDEIIKDVTLLQSDILKLVRKLTCQDADSIPAKFWALQEKGTFCPKGVVEISKYVEMGEDVDDAKCQEILCKITQYVQTSFAHSSASPDGSKAGKFYGIFSAAVENPKRFAIDDDIIKRLKAASGISPETSPADEINRSRQQQQLLQLREVRDKLLKFGQKYMPEVGYSEFPTRWFPPLPRSCSTAAMPLLPPLSSLPEFQQFLSSLPPSSSTSTSNSIFRRPLFSSFPSLLPPYASYSASAASVTTTAAVPNLLSSSPHILLPTTSAASSITTAALTTTTAVSATVPAAAASFSPTASTPIDQLRQ